jgi:hypothetical protein
LSFRHDAIRPLTCVNKFSGMENPFKPEDRVATKVRGKEVEAIVSAILKNEGRYERLTTSGAGERSIPSGIVVDRLSRGLSTISLVAWSSLCCCAIMACCFVSSAFS